MMKKRIVSCALALLLALGCVLPAGAYDLPAVCDETYYATLDYYGAVQEASVVKSYLLNGQTTVTDYGEYDQVVNLTDSAQPAQSGSKVVFTPEPGAEKFYFEGKTTQPFNALPWSVGVSYKLNGAAVRAEELAGRTGLVEIDVDVLPNAGASQYSRANLVLTIATAFNEDDVTSLEAPGAEVQLIGNLRTVLFAVLPGEERHFAIRVGSESFESSGLILLAVPATLAQLDQIAGLREAKEETEDSLEAIDDSLDSILDTLDGMSGSLNTAANGLDRLNTARGAVSARKEDIYAASDGLHDLDSARAILAAGKDDLSQKTDEAIAALEALGASLSVLDQYAQVSTQAVNDTVVELNALNAALQALGPHLETTRSLVVKLQGDTAKLTELLADLESYNEEAYELADDLAWCMRYLENNAQDLESDLTALERALRAASGVPPLTIDDLLGLLPADQQAQMKEVLALHKDYETYLKDNGLSAEQLSFEDYIVAGAYQQFCEQTVRSAVEANAPAAVEQAAAAQAQALGRELTAEELAAVQAQVVEQLTAAAQAQLPSLEQFRQAPAAQEYVQKAAAAAAAYDLLAAQLPLLETANAKLREVNAVLTGLTGPTGKVVGDLADLCREVTSTGLPEDMTDAAEMLRDILDDLQSHEGDGAALLGHVDELGDLASSLTRSGDDLLARVDGLTALVNAYHPDLIQAISDIQATSASLQTTLDSTAAALAAAKELLLAAEPELNTGIQQTLSGLTSATDAIRAAGDDLDAGTQTSLSGLSELLRRSASGLDETGTTRAAKDTIRDLIDEQWNEHSGEVDTLLLMDPEAQPVSMTSSLNPAPRSVQYIMRTQEIKLDDAPQESQSEPEQPKPGFWQRVLDMFVGIWNDIVNFFTGKKS